MQMDFADDMRKPVAKPRLRDGLVKLMIQDIEEGKFGATLPGIRKLMDRYSVSDKPIIEAISSLESVGLLAASEPRKARKIIANKKSDSTKKVVLVRNQIDSMHSLTKDVYRDLRPVVKSTGIKLIEVVIENNSVDHSIDSLTDHGDEVFLIGLDVSHRFVRDLFPAHYPLLQIGGKIFKDDLCSSIGVPVISAVKEIVRAALESSYREVCYMSLDYKADPKNAFKIAVEKGYELAGKKFYPQFHIPDFTPSKVDMGIREIATSREIDLIIVPDEMVWAKVVAVLQVAKIGVPVLSLMNCNQFSYFDHPPVCITPRNEDFSRAISDWLSSLSGGQTPSFERLVRMKYEV